MAHYTVQDRRTRPLRALSTGFAAGLAGGAAEVAWIMLYGQISGRSAAAVADGVTASLFPALGASGAAMPLGIVLHMALAILLGAAIVFALRAAAPRLAGTLREPFIVIAILVAVWAINFLVVLPAINPGFIELVPLGVGLTSKALFGAAAALVLYHTGRSGATSRKQ